MSKIILCTSKTADTPFTFLNTKVEIYTYEELCFYIYNNTVLISKSSLSDKLFEWIRDELGMDELADKLIGMMNKTAYAQDLLIEILSAGNYYTIEEIKNYAEAWQKYRKLDRLQKAKLKADGYLAYRRYIKAATFYDDIIDETDENTDPVFLGNIYHNRGVAAANNMDLEEAKEYFLKAYELNDNPDSMKSYFYIVAITSDTSTLRTEIRNQGLPDDYLEEIMAEIGESKDDVREMTIFAMLQRAAYNKMNKDMTDYDKRMDIILSELKDDFREQAI
jgi:tetratricopeptide (TPR) repeat protein